MPNDYIYILSILRRHRDFEEFSCTRFPFPQQRYESRLDRKSRKIVGVWEIARRIASDARVPQVTTVCYTCIRVYREFRREGLSEFIRRICNNVYSSSRERVFRVYVCMCARVRVACLRVVISYDASARDCVRGYSPWSTVILYNICKAKEILCTAYLTVNNKYLPYT